jgi:ComF family protein
LTDLKNVLTDLFYESVIQNEQFQSQIQVGEWVFAPIPLSSIKLRKRGYNQAEILAQELVKKFNFPVQNLLSRARETKTQVGLTNLQRKLNIKEAFELKIQKAEYGGLNIFLIDDVVTTGSTLLEAAKILKKAGAKKVFGLTLARD